MTFRPYPVMTVLTLISLGILIWLGNWQYGRFIQKMEIDRQTPDWTVLDGEVVPGSEVLSYYYVEGSIRLDAGGRRRYWREDRLHAGRNRPAGRPSRLFARANLCGREIVGEGHL
jgi:hypothetical protein